MIDDVKPSKPHKTAHTVKDVIKHLESIGFEVKKVGESKNNIDEYRTYVNGSQFYGVMVDPNATVIILRFQLSPYDPSIAGSLEFYNTLNIVNALTVVSKWFHQLNTAPSTPSTLVVQSVIHGYEKDSFAMQEELFRNEFGEHIQKFKSWELSNGR